MDLYQGLVLGLLAVSVLVLAGIFTRLGRIGRSLEASTVQPAAAPRPGQEAEPSAVAEGTDAATETRAEEVASEPEPVSDREWELVPVAVQEEEKAGAEHLAHEHEAEAEPVETHEHEAEAEPVAHEHEAEAEPVAHEHEAEAEPVETHEHEAEHVAHEHEAEAEHVAHEHEAEAEHVAHEHEAEAEPVETHEHEAEHVAVHEHEIEPVAVQEQEHEAEPVAAQEAEHEAEQVDTEEPEEKPFRRDGRWWFRRDDELLVYDDASGEWLPSDGGPREASFVIAPDPAPAAAVEPGLDLSRETASVATKERETVSEGAGQIFPEGDATEQLAASSFWKCATCGAVNGSTSASCRMCFAARP
jgi:hypothetical protein